MGKENRFVLKSLGFVPPFLSQNSPRSTICMSHWPYTKPPGLNLNLTCDPCLAGTVPRAKVTAARLTSGSRALVGWSAMSGRSRRSRRCAGRRRRWPELLWPRAQAAEVVGDTCSSQTTAVGFNQSARGAPLGDVEAMRKESRNVSVDYPVHVLRRGHELRRAWSHCSGGASPRLKLGKASRCLKEAIRGLGSSGGGWEWFGQGGHPRAALAGRGEVAGATGELGKVRRGAEGATGKVAVHEGGLYSHARARGRPRARGGARAGMLWVRSRVPAHVEHMVVYFCQCSTACLVALACRSQQKSRVRSLLCTISYLFHVSSKQRYGQGWEILWCPNRDKNRVKSCQTT
jgi:hypothetical protein